MAFEIKDIFTSGLGLAGGFAISHYFHKIQKIESNYSHEELIAALDRNYEQALINGIKSSSTKHAVQTIQSEIREISDIVELKEKMEEALSILKSTKKQNDLPFEQIFRYKSLGDKWSELVSEKLELKILHENGEITKQRLLAVHKSIFPEDFPWAGKFRLQDVYVIDTFGTSARTIDIVQAESKIATISPELIDENLEKLLSHWNASVQKLLLREPTVKINEIAHFHHEFELIHPFIDGNGRIGRMLLEEQLSFLFSAPVTFRPDRSEYYTALRMMNSGENERFTNLLLVELKKFNVI